PLRTYFMGGPHGPNRCSYFCSETVLEACIYAGLLDAKNTRPSATFPRDMFFDNSLNLFLKTHFTLAPCWYPPGRWTSCRCRPLSQDFTLPVPSSPKTKTLALVRSERPSPTRSRVAGAVAHPGSHRSVPRCTRLGARDSIRKHVARQTGPP